MNPFIQEHLGSTFASMDPSPSLVDGAGGKFALAETRTGGLTSDGTHSHGGEIPLAPPSAEDWLLLLKRQ